VWGCGEAQLLRQVCPAALEDLGVWRCDKLRAVELQQDFGSLRVRPESSCLSATRYDGRWWAWSGWWHCGVGVFCASGALEPEGRGSALESLAALFSSAVDAVEQRAG
jgi:hypothetical protein